MWLSFSADVPFALKVSVWSVAVAASRLDDYRQRVQQ